MIESIQHKKNIQILANSSIKWDRTPAYPPDLNPIEDLWSDMKDFVRKKLCKTNEEINKTFKNITQI
ncbi:unnamed protein product [Brachionus calyciflorus]|uniref:Tc1-like transposase DDE domain-containing protein n=1 Tax=Brachionus calyciflorus TaxID=104777 RepID=A0A813X844_9BILA|nr:unnamed protein product [Brachionus calyciflorus]